jgi:predicted helicase
MVKRHPEIKLPKIWVEKKGKAKGEEVEISPDEFFVQVLDVATGTATFLVEVIEVIFNHLQDKWNSGNGILPVIPGQGRGARDAFKTFAEYWNVYVPRALLTRLYGYELMMAPYTIAHMKLGLKLSEINARLGQPDYQFKFEGRAHIYLTNSLEPPSDIGQQDLTGVFPALAHEAQAVNAVKRTKHFTVVTGNPPYSVSSWNTGAWITTLAEDYKRTVRSEESQIQSLSNDYIKFLRFSEQLIEETHLGVLGLITGHGYLYGTQPRDLRQHLSSTFDRCYCLDLHGSLRRSGTDDAEDEPIFQIMTGVAIIIGCLVATHNIQGATIQTSLTGRLSKKFSFLATNTAITATEGITLHKPTPPNYYFAAGQTAQDIDAEYQCLLDLPAVFGTGNRQSDKEVYWATGFASQQDDLAISFSRDEVAKKMAALRDSKSFDELRQNYRLCTTDQWNYSKAKDFARRGLWQEHVGQVAFRPFDRRWTILHKHVLTILRKKVMSNLSGKASQNLGLISSRAVNDLTFAHCFVTNEPVDKIFISSKTSTNAYVFPLYITDKDLYGQQGRPNFSDSFLSALVARFRLPLTGNNRIPKGLTPEDIFHYIYAVFHSPCYRSRYAEFLKIDFPRVPLTSSLELFRALAKLGGELVALHLMESPKLDKLITNWNGTTPSIEVEKITYADATVWIDKAKTEGFRGVPENVWNFHIGGYQVCEKWLKDRKGRKLSADDITHNQKIVVALAETIRLMAEIDKVIEKHGGWPNAFATSRSVN